MEKKPIKRNENIAKLSRDHHASLMFCWKLRQGIKQHISQERMVNYVKYFLDSHMEHHFNEEEEILFQPLQDDKVQKAKSDHVEILRLIKAVLVSDKEDLGDELARLADLVDAHVRYEERILFPHLEQNLTELQLENIGLKISDEPLKDLYEDEFWVRSKSL
ncbi:MAG: hemerythrin domain-containing protein [Ginsengibacter sp.]